MENPSNPDTPVFSPRLKQALYAAAVLAVLILIALFAAWVARKGTTLPSLALSAGPAGPSLLYVADFDTHALSESPITIKDAEGATLYVLSAVRGNGVTYYAAIAETRTFASNIYAVADDGMVTQLTHTPSAKYELSYSNGALAYRVNDAKTDADLFDPTKWEIAELDLATNKEHRLGEGERPVVTPAGTIIAARGASVVSIDPVTGVATPLMTIPSNGLFTADGASRLAVLYDPTTRTVAEFTVTDHGTLSFLRSLPDIDAPMHIAVVSGKVLAIYPQPKRTYVVSEIGPIAHTSGRIVFSDGWNAAIVPQDLMTLP
ncbi:MAG: hypothetical protein ACM3TU_00245 [Bacillota bacterium]